MSSSPKRIVIFGINYAPELTGIAPYTTELAEHFAQLGHEVQVATGLPHYPQWRRMKVIENGSMDRVAVRRFWHYIPRHANAFGRMLYEVSWMMSASRGLVRGRYDVALGVVPSLSGGM